MADADHAARGSIRRHQPQPRRHDFQHLPGMRQQLQAAVGVLRTAR
jgi:hypothetical protein